MNEYPYFNPYAQYMPMQNSAYPPANQIQGVRNLFDWQNKKIIDGAAHVKTLIDMYK